jgi:subtilase family serine protease
MSYDYGGGGGTSQDYIEPFYYDQYRLGGTSLASPLMAGVIARADQTAGSSLGFLNPKLYALYGHAGAVDDITPPSSPQDVIRADYFDGVDAASGIEYSARSINYEGAESYCTTPTKCTSQHTTLETSPGYDNITGIGTPGTNFVTALAAQ